MGVTFQPVHNRKNNNKNIPLTVNIRVTIDRVRKYLSIKQFPKIYKHEWDVKKARVKDTHPFHFELNEVIEEDLKRLRKFHARCLIEKKEVTHDSVKAFYESGTTELNFTQYCKKWIRKTDLDDGTRRHYKRLLSLMSEFKPELYLSDFDRLFLENFINHLRQYYNNNTLRNRIFKLRRLYQAACKEEKITPDYFLFKDLGVKSVKAKRYPLNPEEIQQWIDFDMSNYPDYQLWKDIFSFQLRTGMYYHDVKKAKRSTELKKYGGRIYLDGSRFKGGYQFIVPLDLFPEPMALLDKWDQGQDELFPGLVYADYYNAHLKDIAKIIGIDHPAMSNKVARHSFSDHMVSLGVSRSFLSKMLGHQKEETSNEYFDVNVKLIMDNISKMINNKTKIIKMA